MLKKINKIIYKKKKHKYAIIRKHNKFSYSMFSCKTKFADLFELLKQK